MNTFISPDFEKANNMLVTPSASRTRCCTVPGGEAALLTLTGALQLLQILPKPRSSHPTVKAPVTEASMQGVMPPGSSILGGVSAVEPLRAAGQINHCLGTCVCIDAGTKDCLSSFPEPELKFTGVINGLASTIKATSITHSAQRGPRSTVSCLLFFSRWRRAML